MILLLKFGRKAWGGRLCKEGKAREDESEDGEKGEQTNKSMDGRKAKRERIALVRNNIKRYICIIHTGRC